MIKTTAANLRKFISTNSNNLLMCHSYHINDVKKFVPVTTLNLMCDKVYVYNTPEHTGFMLTSKTSSCATYVVVQKV